jgi:hypothetical protein
MPTTMNRAVQNTCEVVATLVGLAGLPTTLYCAWSVFSAPHIAAAGGGARIGLDLSSDLDIAFVVMLCSYFLLFLCVLIIAVARRVNASTKEADEPSKLSDLKEISTSTPPSPGYENQEAILEATAELNRLADLGRNLDGLFEPLQLEAFRLAKEMREFVANADPLPGLDADGLEKEKLRQLNLRGEWREKLRDGYRLRFRERQEKLLFKFRANGIRTDNPVGQTLSPRLPIEKEIPWEAALLTAIAHRVDGVIVSGAPPE